MHPQQFGRSSKKDISKIDVGYLASLILELFVLELILLVAVGILYWGFQRLLIEDQLVFQILQVAVGKVESFSTWEVGGWWEQWIDSYPECILQHPRYNSFKYRAIHLQAGVVIGLYQPRFEVLIDHKIQPKNLEIILRSFTIQYQIIGFDDID